MTYTESEDEKHVKSDPGTQITMDLLKDFAYNYESKKDRMIASMTYLAKGLSDLSIKRSMAHCHIFPTILKEFDEILFNELEERRRKKQ
jgi:hypothetical protein